MKAWTHHQVYVSSGVVSAAGRRWVTKAVTLAADVVRVGERRMMNTGLPGPQRPVERARVDLLLITIFAAAKKFFGIESCDI